MNQILPPKIDQNILDFCDQLCSEKKPLYVEVRPDKRSKMLLCHINVENKVRKKGGRIVYGWEISVIPNGWLEAQFHSVWEKESKDLVDITPEQNGQNRILFLEDVHRKFDGTKVPLERFLIGNKEVVEKIWFLTDLRNQKWESFAAQGFDIYHPLVIEQTRPLMQKIHDLASTLSTTQPVGR
jgi:hypothetical protein